MRKTAATRKMSATTLLRLQELVSAAQLEHKTRGRNSLPWRQTHDPYAILVSETMLQQTQVARVIPKFELWMKQFPTPEKLAQADTRAVLLAWSGLGYNRRALALKRASEKIVAEFNGAVPETFDELRSLPGVGPYTAGAVLAFAFNKQHPIIETNIRTVFMHHMFPKTKRKISDAEILPLVEQSLLGKSARQWYAALMDYGTRLKQELGSNKTKLHQKSASYARQSKFEGSARQLRAALIKRVLASGDEGISVEDAVKIFMKSKHDVPTILNSLVTEKMVHISQGIIRI